MDRLTHFHLHSRRPLDGIAAAHADRAVARWHAAYAARYGEPGLAQMDDPRSRYHTIRRRVWAEEYEAARRRGQMRRA